MGIDNCIHQTGHCKAHAVMMYMVYTYATTHTRSNTHTPTDIDETVCASNGQSYASVCHMLQDTSMVQVEHAGRCDNPECDTGPVSY